MILISLNKKAACQNCESGVCFFVCRFGKHILTLSLPRNMHFWYISFKELCVGWVRLIKKHSFLKVVLLGRVCEKSELKQNITWDAIGRLGNDSNSNNNSDHFCRVVCHQHG